MRRKPSASFSSSDAKEWETAIRGRRGGTPPVTELDESVTVRWLYTEADSLGSDPSGRPGAAPFVRGTRVRQDWAVRQENGASTCARANAEILEDLEGGATEVLLRLDSDQAGGVPIASLKDLDETLTGVHLDLAPIALTGGTASAVGRLLCELWRRSEIDPQTIAGSLGIDPIGSSARSATSGTEFAPALSAAVGQLAEIHDEFPQVQVLAVDTAPYVDAGAGPVLELAIATATAIAYLRAGEACAIAPEALSQALEFRLSVGTDQFLEIAKFRAMRRLWSNVLEHCAVQPERRFSRTYARSNRRTVSSLDPWANALRITLGVFAAGIGGADGITALPFNEPYGVGYGEPGPTGRRLARNTQLVLLEESFLGRVTDPAGGSWYVEALTEQLAERAWKELQEVERDGGIEALLASGQLDHRIQAQARSRKDQLSHRERTLIGVNAFPWTGKEGLEHQSTQDRGPWGPPIHAAAVRQLSPERDAASFERIRVRAAAAADAIGGESTVLLVRGGPGVQHDGTLQWAENLFACGGIATVVSEPETDPADQARRLARYGLRVVAIYGAMHANHEEQRQLIASLRSAGAQRVYLTAESQTAAADLGADMSLEEGIDLVALFEDLLDCLEGKTP